VVVADAGLFARQSWGLLIRHNGFMCVNLPFILHTMIGSTNRKNWLIINFWWWSGHWYGFRNTFPFPSPFQNRWNDWRRQTD